MSYLVKLLVLIVLFNTITEIHGAKNENFFTKLSRAADKVKKHLLEMFHRFRTFFTGHSQSTHQTMTAKGCGYAVDDEPMIHNKQKKIFAKIKGGDDALWHTWPWIVALYTNARHKWSCAGVLLNENTVLTAAHCLIQTTTKEMKAIIGVHKFLGRLNPTNYYSIKSIHRHPNFENCCKNDLAILKLSKSVYYGPRINAVCLPYKPYLTIENDEELINRTAIIIGWGDSSRNELKNMMKSFNLQQANIRIFDNSLCENVYDSVFNSTTEICAGDYEQRIDTMNGDSGGPLLIREADGRWIVLGITSYGSALTPDTAPGVYVKLSAYQDWIETYLKKT